jgi:hypothetical protein
MADDEPTKPPPTYAELRAANEALTADNAALETRCRRLEAAIKAKDAEAARKPRKPARKLDPNAASAFDRPWNGR